MKFTVFGADGFIGRHLVRHLAAAGHAVAVPPRAVVERCDPAELRDLGHAVCAIGLTGDFRSRPYDTLAAHVDVPARLLAASTFDSWLLLSSTRVYAGLDPDVVADEGTTLAVRPSGDSLYDLSKLTGEALCLGHPHPGVRVARLSNVCGPGQSTATFLGAVVDELRREGTVTIGEAPDSSKDYVLVDDVVTAIEQICERGGHRLYNVAGGVAVRHDALARALAAVSGGTVTFAPGAARRRFPTIAIDRLRDELGIRPMSVLDHLDQVWITANSAMMTGEHRGDADA